MCVSNFNTLMSVRRGRLPSTAGQLLRCERVCTRAVGLSRDFVDGPWAAWLRPGGGRPALRKTGPSDASLVGRFAFLREAFHCTVIVSVALLRPKAFVALSVYVAVTLGLMTMLVPRTTPTLVPVDGLMKM